MQEAFTIRKAIVSLFEDHNVEDSFFDLFFFFEIFREDDLNILLPLAEHLALRNLIFPSFKAPLNATQYSKADLIATLNRWRWLVWSNMALHDRPTEDYWYMIYLNRHVLAWEIRWSEIQESSREQ